VAEDLARAARGFDVVALGRLAQRRLRRLADGPQGPGRGLALRGVGRAEPDDGFVDVPLLALFRVIRRGSRGQSGGENQQQGQRPGTRTNHGPSNVLAPQRR
jgi:hypothetical protein